MEHSVQVGVAQLRKVAEDIAAKQMRTRDAGRSALRPMTAMGRAAEAAPSVFDLPSVAVPVRSQTTESLIRLLDIVGSLAIVVLSFPVMLVSAVLVKLTSRGPVLYKQERVGKDGNVFTLYKFRTMVNDAEKHVGPVWAVKNDDRITPIGRILRRVRLDELPQLYNIFRGEMSLVGPRPERPYFVARHKALQGVRLSVKPGLTGLAQVRSSYDLKPSHKIKYDHLYIQRRSLLLNIYILALTIPVLLARRGW